MWLEYRTYEEAERRFDFKERWKIFDGNRENFNLAHECVDRHPKERTAIRIKFDDRRKEVATFGEVSRLSSQFANILEKLGINAGDPVLIMLNPSLEFYISLFGTLKRGAVVVPCSPLYGPEAIMFRIRKSNAKTVITTTEKASLIDAGSVSNLIVTEELRKLIRNEDEHYAPNTSANHISVIQFSSGTTGIPKAVPYTHGALTFTAITVKFAGGIRDDDRFFCPSSPAWGQGIWYGAIAPLIFGKAIGAYSGKFYPDVFLEALEEFEITSVLAAPTVYRMVMNFGNIDKYKLKIRRLFYSGGWLDMDTIRYFQEKLGVIPQTVYGTTEVGALTLDYGFEDWKIKPGSMGKPMIGLKVAVIDDNGNERPPRQRGQIAVWRKDRWIRVPDIAYVDEDGYFWYVCRSDDVIKTAGYTIGPLEIEEVLQKHPSVREVAVVGSPDKERGEIIKAFVVTDRQRNEELKREIQKFVKTRLGKHEYPREIEFVDKLPKTPDGKIKRKQLRELERARKSIDR